MDLSFHNMLPDILQLGMSAEIRDFTQALPMKEFIEKTSSQTGNTILPILGERLVAHLAQFTSPDVNGNFGIIRGGSMRSFLLDTYPSDHLLAEAFKNPDPQLIGHDEQAKRVVGKVFAEPKDIDVLLIYKGLNEEAVKEDFLYREISKFLGSTPHQDYQIELIKHQYQGQTLVKVNINDKGKPILKFHFGLIPQEERKDIRFFETAADGDKSAIGYLSKGIIQPGGTNLNDVDINVRYFAVDTMTHFDAELADGFFNPLRHPLVPTSQDALPQTLTSNLREINFRIAYLTEIISSGKLKESMLSLFPDFSQLFEPHFINLFVKKAMRFDYKKSPTLDKQYFISKNQKELNESLLLLNSDYFYGITVNPFLFFLFAFPKNSLQFTPLSDFFEDPERTLYILENIAQSFGKSIARNNLYELSAGYLIYMLGNINEAAPFKIIEQLIERGILPDSTPNTMSTFIQCFNPLKPKIFMPAFG